MSSDVNLISWTGGASLAFADHASHGGLIIKILYGVDVLLDQPALHYIFSYWVD